MNHRVVITGIGAVTPIGNTAPDFWSGIQAGKSGAVRISKFDPSEYPSQIAAEIRNFDPSVALDTKEVRRMDPFSQYAVVASVEAMNDAGLKPGDVAPERLGTILGCGIGGFEALETAYFKLFERGPSRVHPMTIPKMISNIGPANVAIRHDAQGPCFTLTTACASGTDAIGQSLFWIRSGLCDVIISGGTEACISKMGLTGFCALQALSTKYNDRPEEASRPFDKDRDGFLIGEGAGIVILESYEHAKARGAKIYAEVVGYGMSCDANHLTAPHPEGRGAILATKAALADAGMSPSEVDYINAHGTSTPINDPTETQVVKQVFGDHAYKLKMSSTKSMTGHCIGAAGGIEAIVCALAIRDQFFPATIHLEDPDPACDLDYVPNVGVHGRLRVAMSNSLGFGGHNGILILKEVDGGET